jgi:hypothetical protein
MGKDLPSKKCDGSPTTVFDSTRGRSAKEEDHNACGEGESEGNGIVKEEIGKTVIGDEGQLKCNKYV